MNDTTKNKHNACAGSLMSPCIAQVCSIPGKLSHWFDSRAKDLAPVFLRVLLAYEFGEAGLEKLHGDNWFAGLAFPFPVNLLPVDVSWTMATGLEVIGSIALFLGLMTRFFCAAFIVLTVVAIAAVHWPAEWHSLGELWKGYAITDQGYGNFKLPLMYLLLLAALMFSGGGRLSVDDWLRQRLS